MDKQVQLALAKWPNVPHCYGWLGLDARGVWRMRDQHAQELNLLGDKITNAALCGFINRNYQADLEGRYFFQNGPQRVYVELQATPYIARADGQDGWVLHTGVTLDSCDVVWMMESGNLVLQSGSLLAQIDDRDLAQAYESMQLHAQRASDEQLLAWLEQPQEGLSFTFHNRQITVRPTTLAALTSMVY